MWANLEYQGLAQERIFLWWFAIGFVNILVYFSPFFFFSWVWGFQNYILPPLVFYVWLIAAMLSNSLYDVQMLHLSSPPSICIKHVIFIFLFVALAFSFFFLTMQAELSGRGVRKVQVGFPLLFVCMVALISVVLGHLLHPWTFNKALTGYDEFLAC